MPVVDEVAVVGGGVMGGGIGQALLQHGYAVSIRDVDADVLEATRERMVSGNFGLERAVEGGHLTEAEKSDALDRLEMTLDLEAAVEGADLVMEAVTEDLGLKGRVFRELDAVTDGDVPLVSNTSGFSVAALSSAVADPGRVAVAHFFNPAQIMELVEVVRGPETDEAVVELLEALVGDLGKTPIVIDDHPTEYGFVVNRLWAAMQAEAREVVRQGIATEEQVNLAMRAGRNLPVGPLEGAGIGEEWG